MKQFKNKNEFDNYIIEMDWKYKDSKYDNDFDKLFGEGLSEMEMIQQLKQEGYNPYDLTADKSRYYLAGYTNQEA